MGKMSLWRRLGAAFTALAGDAGDAEEPASAAKPAGFREALGVTVDADEDKWRQLTEDSRRDLSPLPSVPHVFSTSVLAPPSISPK